LIGHGGAQPPITCKDLVSDIAVHTGVVRPLCTTSPIRLATRGVRLLECRACGSDSCRFSWSSALSPRSPTAGPPRARSGPPSQILIAGPSSAGRSGTAPRRGLPRHRGLRAMPACRRRVIPRSSQLSIGSRSCIPVLACRRHASSLAPHPSAAVPSLARLLACPHHASEPHGGSRQRVPRAERRRRAVSAPASRCREGDARWTWMLSWWRSCSSGAPAGSSGRGSRPAGEHANGATPWQRQQAPMGVHSRRVSRNPQAVCPQKRQPRRADERARRARGGRRRL
jgi:hypothetical protein